MCQSKPMYDYTIASRKILQFVITYPCLTGVIDAIRATLCTKAFYVYHSDTTGIVTHLMSPTIYIMERPLAASLHSWSVTLKGLIYLASMWQLTLLHGHCDKQWYDCLSANQANAKNIDKVYRPPMLPTNTLPLRSNHHHTRAMLHVKSPPQFISISPWKTTIARPTSRLYYEAIINTRRFTS